MRLQDPDVEMIQVLLNEVEAAAIATEDFSEDYLRQWFSDLCADCVQIFISHPSVQVQLGIDAVFNGRDGPFQGFEVMGAARGPPHGSHRYLRPRRLAHEALPDHGHGRCRHHRNRRGWRADDGGAR
ncbi:MAG: hypothetical protein AAYR33_09490 [Acetobacteraceae bacterium]